MNPTPLERQVAGSLDGLLDGLVQHEVVYRRHDAGLGCPRTCSRTTRRTCTSGRWPPVGSPGACKRGAIPPARSTHRAEAVLQTLAAQMNAPAIAEAMDRGVLADVAAQIDAWRLQYNTHRHH